MDCNYLNKNLSVRLSFLLHYPDSLPQMASSVFCNATLCFMLILLVLVPIFSIAQPYSNFSSGSSLVANEANSSWLSPSGDFAFGFRQIAPGGGYLLGIWFDKIPEKTVIWSANRDNPAAQGSKIQIYVDGRFELDDPRGQPIWTANLASSGVAYGAMLDTGNFVLVSNASAVLWRSFDYPTDTILPAQILNQGGSLVSGFSETNYSSGRFRFSLQLDGNLELYTRNFPMDNNILAYWTTQTVGSGFQVIFNQSGYIFLTAKNGTVLDLLSSNGASTGQYYQREILDYDGVLRHYVYPKSGDSTSGRPAAWSVLDFFPSNICMLIRQSSGSGACGFNSICSIGFDQNPSCVCPTGYSLADPNDRMSGCKPDFISQVCDQESQETSHFTFVAMPNTDFPDDDYNLFQPVGEDWCRQACLDDCLCAVAIFRGGSCWKKKYPLSNGRVDPSLGGKALIKVRTTNATLAPSGSNPNKSNRSTLIITRSALLGSSVFLNILFVAFFLFGFYLKGRKSKMLQPYTVLSGVVNIRSFSFKELKEATNGFKEELGSGACSTVYKGTLKNENDRLIAVKKLKKIAKEVEQEFKAEVNSISRTNHKNLVQLLGYCDEGENRLLVYEYMSNGSIASFLFNESRPNWYRRVQIAFATARGLCYLHEDCSTQIIHCDIKPQNVLLDESLVAKISDFGLAKLLRPDQTRTITGIRGTRGYVAPEWFRNLPITVMVDVYSFGILLLELICCRRNVETYITNENNVILADWAYDCYKEGTLRLLVSDDEEALDDIKRFEKFVMVAIWCIQEDPSLRPNMKRVLHMLEGSVEVPLPPDPESFMN